MTTLEAEMSVPVIDLAVFDKPSAGNHKQRLHALDEVRKACEEWGFFQVVNSGLDPPLLDRACECSKQFFELPVEKKLRTAARYPFGFVNRSGGNGVVDNREHLLFYGPENPKAELNVWPETPETYRTVVQELMREAMKASKLLTRIVFESLGLPEDASKKLYNELADTFIMPFYPASPPDVPDVVLGQHRDAGILTLLAQLNNVAGLQVLKDGRWITVEPVRGALIVNIADVMQVWTNGRYKSVMHRVAKNEMDRYSCAYFHIPGAESVIVPLPQFVNDENPPRYREFLLGEYLQMRLENRKLNKDTPREQVSIEYYSLENKSTTGLEKASSEEISPA